MRLYLQRVVDHFHLPVKTGTDVLAIEPLSQCRGFILRTSVGDFKTQFVIWAAGEFQYPRLNPFLGADHCIHNSQIRSWSNLTGDEFTIIGGYESGMDAATHLVALGKKVRVLDRTGVWGSQESDPSISLSPYTLQRLGLAYQTGRLELISNATIGEVKKSQGAMPSTANTRNG